mmetsp:Transcript_117879/g.313584  ORF Transcript_117879/g.313584 Transcript_117879/m.313584 type:complete len:203 (+) Transcript_117879:988-1596(+)
MAAACSLVAATDWETDSALALEAALASDPPGAMPGICCCGCPGVTPEAVASARCSLRFCCFLEMPVESSHSPPVPSSYSTMRSGLFSRFTGSSSASFACALALALALPAALAFPSALAAGFAAALAGAALASATGAALGAALASAAAAGTLGSLLALALALAPALPPPSRSSASLWSSLLLPGGEPLHLSSGTTRRCSMIFS